MSLLRRVLINDIGCDGRDNGDCDNTDNGAELFTAAAAAAAVVDENDNDTSFLIIDLVFPLVSYDLSRRRHNANLSIFDVLVSRPSL